MRLYKRYRIIFTFCFFALFSFLFSIRANAADPTTNNGDNAYSMRPVTSGETQPQFSLCTSPPTNKFKTYKSNLLGVELEIPDIWEPEVERDEGKIKFIGSNKDCEDAGILDYTNNIKGFVPDKPYTLMEGKRFFGQQWMKPEILINNMKVIKTNQGYSATYSVDDFVGIAGVKLPKHTTPLVLVVFAERDGAYIEKRMLRMLDSLKYIRP